MKLRDLLDQSRVLFLDETDRDAVLTTMAEHAAGTGLTAAGTDFENAILQREQTVSTGIGLGVAVPHAKLPTIESFFIVLGVLRHAVEWDAIDQQPVRLVFMIGGPADQQSTYLQILAKVVLITKNGRLRSAIEQAGTAEQALSVLAEI